MSYGVRVQVPSLAPDSTPENLDFTRLSGVLFFRLFPLWSLFGRYPVLYGCKRLITIIYFVRRPLDDDNIDLSFFVGCKHGRKEKNK